MAPAWQVRWHSPMGVSADRLHVQVIASRQPQALPFDGCAIADGFHLLPARLEPPRSSNGGSVDSPGDRARQSSVSQEIIGGQATRPISTGKLHALPHFHLRPINHVVYVGSSGALRLGTPYLEGGFPLRCFQRLSRPNIATRRCRWRDNRNTIGSSNSVLSY